MKKAAPILLIFLLAGCGNSLKHSWNNFTAYYNTFYNAQKNFNAGLTKVERQPVHFSPDTLVLPHRIPPLAGKEDFEQADRDAAQLLRRFSNSKWTNKAVLLLGKSYYYQHQFYKAQQKFEEILESPDHASLEKHAILWKGRILLNLHSYKGDMQFLGKALNTFDEKWHQQQKAKVYILIAENQAKLGNWNQAAKFLNKAIPNISKHKLAGEADFLLGQVFERNENYKKAFATFSRVGKAHSGYAYRYWAGIKKIETARLLGRLQQAMTIASAMADNNKNFDQRSEIYYQQALNYRADGNYHQAAAFFKKSLNNNMEENLPRLKNQSYYKLGVLYSRYLDNYDLAVAYFDSASVQSLGIRQSKKDDPTRHLISSYKRYAAFKKDIQTVDSLLKLGSLNEQELREKITAIKRIQRQTNNKKEEVLPTRNRITSNDGVDYFNKSGPVKRSSRYGFLNYKNPRLVKQGKRKFAAIWGQRPVADNWRRSETISGAAIDSNSDNVSKEFSEMNPALNNNAELDLSNIPRTQKDRKKLDRQRKIDQFKLGNLFFLNFHKPDSAAYYYHLGLEGSTSEQMKLRTFYSLYKLYQLNHQPDSAIAYKQKILQTFPSSTYAKQIVNHTGQADTLKYSDNNSNGELLPKVHVLEKRQDLNNKEVALKMQKLAVKYRHDTTAPAIYLEGIRRYIEYAKEKDSSRVEIDLLKTNPDSKHTYGGKYWDHVRSMLVKFRKTFPNAPQQEQVNSWLAVLESSKSEKKIHTCKELGIQPVIIGGKKKFLESVKMPEKVKGMHISGKIRFKLMIQRDGSVSSIQLMSRPTNLGIEPAYVHAIREFLHFKPVEVNRKLIKVSCIESFPIKTK